MDKPKIKESNLAFFMTRGMSLSQWKQIGILDREIKPYNVLAKSFNQIYIFSYGGREELKYKKYLASNIEIIYNSLFFKKFYYYFLPLLNYKIIKRCHFIKTNQIRGSFNAISSKLINRRAKLIVRAGYLGSEVHRKNAKKLMYYKFFILEYMAYKLCDRAIVASKEMKRIVVSRYLINGEKIRVVPNYVDIKEFFPKKSIKKFNSRILYVGRLSREKNLINLIKALENTGITLDIIGDGPLKDEIFYLSNNLKVKVNFLNIIPNHKLTAFFNDYNIFVLPSFYEGMPKVLLEAMSCGLSCIGTRVSGTREIITDYVDGLISGTGAKDLKNKILELLNDKQLQKKIGLNARKLVEDKYSLEVFINKEFAIYKELAVNIV